MLNWTLLHSFDSTIIAQIIANMHAVNMLVMKKYGFMNKSG